MTRITHHALERYRLHHPDAERQDLLLAVGWAELVAPDVARAVLQRVVKREDGSTFLLAPDRKGMFVLCNDAVVTYLRFQPSQQAMWDRHAAGTTTQPAHAGTTTQPAHDTAVRAAKEARRRAAVEAAYLRRVEAQYNIGSTSED